MHDAKIPARTNLAGIWLEAGVACYFSTIAVNGQT
ncbi:hypothetical protein ACVWWO_006018 [Bradyrhizobium sp. F1.13.1]